MERQKYSKPHMARFFIYRWLVGGVWRKYGYYISTSNLDGWYWTRNDLTYACKGQLALLKILDYGVPKRLVLKKYLLQIIPS